MFNSDIREAIAEAKVRYWQVAAAYGCTDGNFSRKLRHELPPEEKEQILAIIRDLSGRCDDDS